MGLPADLPPGRLVTPKLWVSEGQVPDVTTVWASLHAGHAQNGWWPLLLAPDIDLGDFGPSRNEIVDAEPFLMRRWESDAVQLYTDPASADEPAQLIPYRTWPGLAPACPPGPDPDEVVGRYVTSTEVRAGAVSDPFSHLDVDPDTLVPNPFVGTSDRVLLGLVESPDSAGTVAASGWGHQLGGGAQGTAVLHSWQERFGVRLYALGYDWLSVTVARPVPMNETELARRVAAEHVAFCPDILGEIAFADYANGLIAATVWRFWWD